MMLLNMDRNTLWGSAGGMVFESKTSWDVRDRMEAVEGTNKKVYSEALGALAPTGEGVALFNPLNWERHDPVMLEALQGKGLEGFDCQSIQGKTLCSLRLPSLGITGIALAAKAPEAAKGMELPPSIETKYYSARIDPNTGALASLKLKPSGREVLGGAANVLVAEKPKSQHGDPGDFMLPRPERTRLASSSDSKPTITVTRGPLATTVEITSKFFGGGPARRLIQFYENYPRIDFETELNDIPDLTVVVAEFPLAADVDEVRRAIPNGFSHGAWAKPNPDLPGWTKGIVPAVGWIHYTLAGGGGVAILDRGLSGRELNDRTPIIYLLNATDKYYGWPNPWLSGKGKNVLAYASGCARRKLGPGADSADGLGIQQSPHRPPRQASDPGEVVRPDFQQPDCLGDSPGRERDRNAVDRVPGACGHGRSHGESAASRGGPDELARQKPASPARRSRVSIPRRAAADRDDAFSR